MDHQAPVSPVCPTDRIEDVLTQLDELDITSLLSELVARPSFEQEEMVGKYLLGRFRALGLETTVTEISPGRFNVLAHYGPPGRQLILNSHMDTVPPGDEAAWSTSPLEPVARGGRLYGRGACDAKGPLAAMVAALEALVRSGISLRGRLTLMAVAYEETSALGTIAEAERLAGDTAAIIGEPTELELHLAHKGVLRMRITALGRAAHASTPQEGVNAISGIARAIQALDDLGDEIARRRHPLVGHSSLAVTTIRGGMASNVIPDRCQIVIDRRLIPGEELGDAQQEIEGTLRGLEDADPSLNMESEVHRSFPPSQTAADAPFVAALRQAGREALGREPEIGGFLACCDMWPFREREIPALVFGPGELAQAHTTDEWVELAQVEAAARFYTLAALRWLGAERRS
ncbi:MAG: M20 family metallopeptidase [Chloroflexota bacterium]|nr:M20 family metallopeptidase [Chloroflexota bacterium]